MPNYFWLMNRQDINCQNMGENRESNAINGGLNGQGYMTLNNGFFNYGNVLGYKSENNYNINNENYYFLKDRNNQEKILTLRSLSSISQTQLITRADIKKEIVSCNIKGKENYCERLAINNIIQREINNNQFIPIPYTIIPKTIMNIMFQQGDYGICYLGAGINAFNDIPSIVDQIFIDKNYSEKKKEYKLNAFINSKKMVFSLDDIFLYQVLGNNKNMYMYEGCQTYKYELFLKFIVKLFAVLNQSKAEPDKNEIKYSYNKLKNIEEGRASEIYSCFLGTNTLNYNLDEQGIDGYIDNIEKYNIPGNILATGILWDDENGKRTGHQYAIKNMFEYIGKNGKKQKFITIFNPWGYGDPDKEHFAYEEVQEESENYEFVYEFNKKYNKSGLIKIPLNLFYNWFTTLEVCIPRYGFHYKVIKGYVEKNISHYYCFCNDKIQNIEIELFLDELENVRILKKQFTNIEIYLYKIIQNYNIFFIEKNLQNNSKFLVRKNAYIYYENLEEGNYFIIIQPIHFEKK